MLKFDRQGLIPAVIQDDATNEVLMVAFMNEEAFDRTRETGYTHFFSRSRNKIWRKGEQSGNIQEVRTIFVNCEENSLLIRVVQHGDAACHTGHRSCYYRRLLPDGTYETVAERLFDPEIVYAHASEDVIMNFTDQDRNGHAERVSRSPERSEGEASLSPARETLSEAKGDKTFPFLPGKTHNHVYDENTFASLETRLRQLYGVYLYLRDHDLSEESNTSRLLQERSQGYLVARLADELQELGDVQSGEHVHAGRQPDTILEGSQVEYWLLLLAATLNLHYDNFAPHSAILSGYSAGKTQSEGQAIEQRQECLDLLATNEQSSIVRGLHFGFALIGWACAEAEVSPLAPAEYDLEQMRRKGLIGQEYK